MRVFIECEAGSFEKGIYDEKTLKRKGSLRLGLPYPYPYGFVPGTVTAEGDAVDCYVITHDHVSAGSSVECVPIGLLELQEDGEADHKVIAVPSGQPVLPSEDVYQILQGFIYGIFSRFPGSCVMVGKMLGADAALEYIRNSKIGAQV